MLTVISEISASKMLNGCRLLLPKINVILISRGYAIKQVGGSSGLMGLGKGKKGGGGGPGMKGPATEKPVLTAETDPEKLVNYLCGSNIMTTGEDIKLKPDSEYPDWLWKLNVGPAPKLEDMDPNTKAYWLKVRQLGIKRNNQLNKFKGRQ